MTAHKTIFTQTTHVSLCGENAIVIGGRTLTPDPDKAYCDFSLSFAFPAKTKYQTAIHPQVVANSFMSLEHKVFNLAHMMRKYDPQTIPQDRILGLVVAVEFPNKPDKSDEWRVAGDKPDSASPGTRPPSRSWNVQADPAQAPGIRAVAAMIKAADGFEGIYAGWQRGDTPWGGAWTVSMESEGYLESSGFAVLGSKGIESFVESTPPDIQALGYTYVPAGRVPVFGVPPLGGSAPNRLKAELQTAPLALLDCLNNAGDDARDGMDSCRIKRDFMGQDVTYLIEGLNGKIRYKGVGLAPHGMEDSAKISTILASAGYLDVGALFAPLHEFADRFLKKV